MITGTVHGLFMALAMFEKPTASRHYYNWILKLITPETHWALLLSWLFDLWAFQYMWSSILFYMFSFILWVFPTLYWLEEIR